MRWILWAVPGLGLAALAMGSVERARELRASLIPDVYSLSTTPGRHEVLIRPFRSERYVDLRLASKADPDEPPPFIPSAVDRTTWRFKEGPTVLYHEFMLLEGLLEQRPRTLEYEVRSDTAAWIGASVLRMGIPPEETKRVLVAASVEVTMAKAMGAGAAVWLAVWGLVLGWRVRRVNEMTASKR